MRSHRFTLAVATAVVASLAVAADAAPKKPSVCMQMVDPGGDAKAFDVSDSPALDIVSGDLATGPRNLVVALRLATLERDQTQAGGVAYTFKWTVGGVTQHVVYNLYATGESIGAFDPDSGSKAGEIVVPTTLDPTTNAIMWTVPRKLVDALKKRNAKFGGFTARSDSAVNGRVENSWNTRVIVFGGDDAVSGKSYVDNTPTCLRGT